MNNVSLTGRLTKDPGTPRRARTGEVLDIRLAVNDARRPEPVYVNVRCWGPTATNVSKYLKKGSQVAVSGELAEDRWHERGSGEPRSAHYINAQRVDFLDQRLDRAAAAPSAPRPNAAGVY